MKHIVSFLLVFITLNMFAQMQATQFNGYPSYVYLGTTNQLSWQNSDISNKLTVMAWVKWLDKSNAGNWANMVTLNRNNGNGDNGVFWLQHNQNNDRFEFAAEANNRQFIQGTTNPQQGQWYHITGVYNGNEIRIYVDGVLEGTNTNITGNLNYNNGNNLELYFGRWATNQNRNFNGCIAEVKIWNIALTTNEIETQMYSQPNINNNLLGYWSLLDYQNIVDSSAYENNPINTNMLYACIDNPLPIELNYFTAKKDGVLVSNIIEWSTYTERNNDYFTIERSVDGINWKEIATVNGAGSTTEEHKYTYSDKYFKRDTINYYRLKQTDYDGLYEYFDIVSVDNRSNKKVKIILNTLGQEVDLTYKGIIIIMYDDGTSIKKYNR